MKKTKKHLLALSSKNVGLSSTKCNCDVVFFQVPKDISCLTVKQLADCMRKIKLRKYADAFEEEDIDGQLLMSLNEKSKMEDIMIDIFHMNKLEAHKVWEFAHKNWRPQHTNTPL